MFVEIFYVFSLLSVTPHDPSFSIEVIELPPDGHEGELMDCIIEEGV